MRLHKVQKFDRKIHDLKKHKDRDEELLSDIARQVYEVSQHVDESKEKPNIPQST